MQEAWAITSFYNPLRGAARKRNYQVFRRHLELPLLTVEWSLDGRFELGPGDAEILLQISGGDLMWQKERLLNLGLARLPDGCRYVAWIDCDVVFHRRGWSEHAVRLCATRDVVQLYESFRDLPETDAIQGTLDDILSIPEIKTRPSIARVIACGGAILSASSAAQTDPMDVLPSGSVGMAFMASRDFLNTVSLYDANVVGGGDLTFVAALLDRLDELFTHRRFSAAHRADVLRWSGRVRRALSGRRARFEALPLGMSHLWHGVKAKRGYAQRYQILEAGGFDPSADLRIDPAGLWCWSSGVGALQAAVEAYIVGRSDA